MAIRKRFRTRPHPMGELYLDGRKVRVLDARTVKGRQQFLVSVTRREQQWINADRFTKTDARKSTRPKGGHTPADESLRQQRKSKPYLDKERSA